MEATLHDNEITPDDSASQLGFGVRNKSKRSECGSRSSRFSRTSSISTARAKEAARIAELRAEVSALKQRYSLQETELRLKKQECELQLKKDELNPKTEYAKAVAREEAYAQAEAGHFAPSDMTSNRCLAVSVPSTNTKESKSDSPKRAHFVPSDKNVKPGVKPSTMPFQFRL